MQMKLWHLYFSVFSIFPLSLFGQEFLQVSYKEKPAENIVSPAALAQKLILNNFSEKQKVASIFRWITDNINYKIKPNSLNRRPSYSKISLEDSSSLKSLNERVAEKVLEDGEAYCEGYARLFSTLCSFAGIKSEVVHGYAKSNIDKAGKNFRSNHTWNAVFIDSAWHLLDVTWASGYITFYGENFVRQYDDYYYLTPPAQFIRTHYPEDLNWTLLPQTPTLKEFETSPFKYKGYYTRYVKSLKPVIGNIVASVGDTLVFEVEAGEKSDHVRVVDVNEIDSLPLSQVQWWEHPKPQSELTGNVVKGFYVVNDPAVKSLHVIYGNAVIVRYSLNIIEKPKQQTLALK